MLLSSTQILETAQRDVPLGNLIKGGARLIQGKFQPLSERTLMRLTDSQEALALVLGEDVDKFYDVASTIG